MKKWDCRKERGNPIFSGCYPKIHVIASQCSHWRGPSQAFPRGEGGSRVPRKRETDEGLASPFGRGAPQGRRGRFYPLSHFVTAPPKWEPRGTRETDCHVGHWPPRNDSVLSFLLGTMLPIPSLCPMVLRLHTSLRTHWQSALPTRQKLKKIYKTIPVICVIL